MIWKHKKSIDAWRIIGNTNYKLRITNYELRITNYELQITNYELQHKLLIIHDDLF
jgi:hypothetical protein